MLQRVRHAPRHPFAECEHLVAVLAPDPAQQRFVFGIGALQRGVARANDAQPVEDAVGCKEERLRLRRRIFRFEMKPIARLHPRDSALGDGIAEQTDLSGLGSFHALFEDGLVEDAVDFDAGSLRAAGEVEVDRVGGDVGCAADRGRRLAKRQLRRPAIDQDRAAVR